MANTFCQFFYPSLYQGSTVSRIETDFRCQNKDSFEFNNHSIIILKPINLSCGKALMLNGTYLYENIYIESKLLCRMKILKTMKNESLLCFCATRFTAVAALQAQQSVFINLLRHRRNCNYNYNGSCNSQHARAISVISNH